MAKELYNAPAAKVVELKTQGVLCQSAPALSLDDPSDYANGGDPFSLLM